MVNVPSAATVYVPETATLETNPPEF